MLLYTITHAISYHQIMELKLDNQAICLLIQLHRTNRLVFFPLVDLDFPGEGGSSDILKTRKR